MARARRQQNSRPAMLAKCPTGIKGLDEITEGGLPRGRPTLVCGSAGSGKTLLGMEFVVRGATEFDEPGVFVSFEENADELGKNVASLGFDVPRLVQDGKLAIDFVYIERSEIEETGEYDLEGLFVRLGAAIDSIGAKRVVLDTLEALFGGLPNEGILRAELRRLFRWLKDRKVTAVITGEQGDRTLTRYGLEEYVSDCVIFLDHRVVNQVATRRLRIVKYRGSRHGTNEYPTLIDERGLSVLPISSLGLTYPVTNERVSSGIPRLDAMLGGKGYYKGSSILVSGTSGTGKSSLAAAFAAAVCTSGGKVVYFSFEESPDQIVRNMRSIGLDLDRHLRSGRLRFHNVRPTVYGLELHLTTLHKVVEEFGPDAVIIDPITNMQHIAARAEVTSMLTRIIDFLKNRKITSLMTSLTTGGDALEQTEIGISSLMDTWLLVRMVESNGERNRLLYVLKSRGMAHSNQMREFRLSDRGIELQDVYVGEGTVLTGSARMVQEAQDRAGAAQAQRAAEQRGRELRQEQAALEAQIAALSARLGNIANDLKTAAAEEAQRLNAAQQAQDDLASARMAD